MFHCKHKRNESYIIEEYHTAKRIKLEEGNYCNGRAIARCPRVTHDIGIQPLKRQATTEEKQMKMDAKKSKLKPVNGNPNRNFKNESETEQHKTNQTMLEQKGKENIEEPVIMDKRLEQAVIEQDCRELKLKLRQHISRGSFSAKYLRFDKFGNGGSCEVFAGRRRGSERKVAVKVTAIRKKGGVRNRVLTEIQVLKSLHHPNILEYLDTYLIKDELWLVTEFIEGVTLAKMAWKTNVLRLQTETCLPGYEFVAICRQVLEALVYIHSHHIMHMDIKSTNIVLRVDGCVKLIDFGLSTWRKNPALFYYVGTPGWMAPEVTDSCWYDYNADIWSLGITMLEMLNGRPPRVAPGDASDMITPCDRPRIPAANPHIFCVLDRCLRVDPMERASAELLLSFCLFQGSDDLKRKQWRKLRETVQRVMQQFKSP